MRRQRLLICEEDERVQRRCILRVARQIFDPFPRSDVRGRIRLRGREDENCTGENLVRFCALIGQRAFSIIDCKNSVAPASGELAGEQDIEWCRALRLSKELINLVPSRR